MRRSALIALLAAGACAPAADAAVTISDREVVVSGDGARVVVQRDPLRLTFTDGAGRTVLRQVEAPPVPTPAGGTDAVPGSFSNPPERDAYAPFAFEVGGERSAQYPGLLYQGNMMLNARAGVVHHATRVTEAAAAGAGAKLTVATTDPSRTLVVELQPDRGSSIRVIATPSNGAGISALSDAFASDAGEAFRGFGGRHNALDQRGQDFLNWLEQENAGSSFEDATKQIPGSGGDRYMFPGGPHGAYHVQNLFVSSKPYGFLLNRNELSRWRMAAERPDAWRVAAAAPTLDYTVAVGDAPRVIESLTAINGRQRVAPEHATGANLKRGVHIFNDTIDTYRAKIESDLKEIERRDLPITGYSFEGWHGLPKDFVRSVIKRLRARGVTAHGYMRAFIANDGPFFDDEALFKEATDNNLVAQTPTGQDYLYFSSAPAAVIDFTNPATVKWWERRVREMLDLGFDGFMNDFGEQTVADMRFHDGRTGAEMHNEYPILHFRVTREITERYEREHPGREISFYTRAGFSGRPGSVAYDSANFPGDETTDYQRSSGLPSLATDMLNRGLGGAYGFNTDIGGYFDGSAQARQTLDEELFVRWAEWSALTPFYRVHNSCCTQGTRMPWAFGDQGVARWRALADLHDEARPYTRRLWEEATRTGMPIMRPLWLAFPGDAEAAKEDQQWMLGPEVLVAPVVAKGSTKRSVYFPRGCWEHGTTGQRFEGAARRDVAAPLGQLPYFFRCGARPFERAAATSGGVALPSARRCTSRRSFTIRVREPRGRRLRAVRVVVDGRRVRVVRRGGRLRARVDLRGKRRSTYRVRVSGRTKAGRRVSAVRTYRTCVPRRTARG